MGDPWRSGRADGREPVIPDSIRCRHAEGCRNRAAYPAGLCPAHTQQQRRHGATAPIREAEPAAARIGVRLSATALSALGPRPAARAREVIEEWANGQQPPT